VKLPYCEISHCELIVKKKEMAVKPSQELEVWKLQLHPVQRIPYKD
jgi:hypothetical protein